MANDNKYIPVLRFPEFQNDGEWKCVHIGDAIKTITPPKKLPSSDYKDSGKFPIVDQSLKYIAGYSNDNTAVVHNDGASIVFGDHTCTLKLIYFPFIQGADGIKIFKSKTDDLVTEYIYQHILANPVVSAEYKRHFSDLKEKILSYPTTTTEQNKIADCLSSLDKYVDATKRKLDLLKEHKKGLMQRLFPDKGKTIPALRFPEFQNEGEWNYENGDILYGSIVNKKHKSDLPILAITQENGAIPRDEINYRVVVEDKSIEWYKVVEIGDFIISLRLFQGGIEYSRYKGLCSPAYIVLRKRHSKICDDFYRHYFKSFQYIQELNRNLEGIRDGKMVSYKQFADIKLPYPCYEEQCKIAKCLSSIDDVIQSYIEKKTALELHKNGLMQQLFPKL